MSRFPSKGLRLNVGSGQRKFSEPWINVDCQDKWEPDVVAEACNMPMFATGSADIIVLHHVLEHFGCGEATPMLQECHRILAHGGSLLVFVPDMRRLADMWIQGRISTQIYITNVYGAYMGNEADRHKWGYVAETLQSLVRFCGYRRGMQFDWRNIPGADIALDTWILGMEFVK